MSLSRTARKLTIALIATAPFLGCTPGAVTDVAGRDPTDTTSVDTNTIQRGALNVRVGVDGADAATAAAAGIGVAGLTVFLKRDASSEQELTGTTDANGVVRFDRLLQGSYHLRVDRPLTSAEQSRLTPEDRDVSLFSGGAAVIFAPPSREASVDLVAARRGSLVLAEFYIYSAQVGGLGNNGHYIEFYNNGDTTVYLGGMLLFRAALGMATPEFPCSLNQAIRLDESGVWADRIERFPGSRTDFPVAPGGVRIWALNAIDHRPVGSGMLNLTAADFESIGNDADPNDPGAADMVRLTQSNGPYGLALTSSSMVGIALPIAQDTSQLQRMLATSYVNGTPYSVFKIPRAAVVDAVGLRQTVEWETQFLGNTFVMCQPMFSPAFERSESRLVDFSVPMAISRKSLGRTPGGQLILQRTHTAARDFERASPLLRSLLKVPS